MGTGTAVWLGKLIGACLAECGPIISEIISHAIRNAFTDTVDEGSRRVDLRARLLARLRDAHASDPLGGPGTPAGTNPPGQGVGG